MKVLDRYLAWEFARNFIVVIGIVASLLAISEIVDNLGDMLENNTPISTALSYLAARLPMKLSEVIPIATMVAALFTIGGLARNNEILAMLTGGVSIYRLVVPLVVVAGTIAALHFTMAETIGPHAERVANHIDRVNIQGKTPLDRHADIVASGRGDATYAINTYRYDDRGEVMQQVTIWWMDAENWVVSKRLDARKATFLGTDSQGRTTWEFDGAIETEFDFRGNIQEVTIHEKPIQRSLTAKLNVYLRNPLSPEEMNALELREYSATLAARGVDTAPYDTDLQLKFAQPLASLSLLLLAVACGMKAQRGSLVVGFGLGLILTLAYYLTTAFMRALGHASTFGLPPAVFAWTTFALFGALGLHMLRRSGHAT